MRGASACAGAPRVSFRRCKMSYSFLPVKGHIEVYDENGTFLFSADTRAEAWLEAVSMLNEL